MKHLFLILSLSIFTLGCSKNDDDKNDNPFLTYPPVNANLSLNLNQYNPLKFPGNSVIIPGGIRGIVIYCATEDLYFAFELSDPNHSPNDCSQMTVDGVIASCPCENDNNSYFITSGQHTSEPNNYPMQQYRVVRDGNTIRVSN